MEESKRKLSLKDLKAYASSTLYLPLLFQISLNLCLSSILNLRFAFSLSLSLSLNLGRGTIKLVQPLN